MTKEYYNNQYQNRNICLGINDLCVQYRRSTCLGGVSNNKSLQINKIALLVMREGHRLWLCFIFKW